MTTVKPTLGSIGAARRKTVSVSDDNLVEMAFAHADGRPPLVVEPKVEGVNPAPWLARNRERIEGLLLRHGGLIFRNFRLRGVDDFERFIKAAVADELLEYGYQSTPRSAVSGQIYTSTEYPASQTIPLHNEMAYADAWPMKIWFHCMTPAERGGETPVADSRRVFARVPPGLRSRFIEKKVMYVRNYGEGLDLSWSTAFQTDDRLEVEAYCRRAGIDFEWLDGGHLRTRQVCQAAAAHPRTGEWVWFNQAHLFHVSNLEPAVRDALSSTYREEDYPRNAFYGDGSPIEGEALADIREAYERETVVFDWQAGDVLMLDNMLMAHGRKPFEGARSVVVGMTQSSKQAGARLTLTGV